MRRSVALLLLAAWAASAVAAATSDELADLEAKADYAYLTEDLRTLALLAAEQVALGRSPVLLERYQYAHVEFRLLQVALGAGQREQAARASAACVGALEPALKADAPDAEALVLAGLCQGLVSGEGRLAGRLQAAERAAPANPRVLLARAWDYSLRELRPAERPRALAAARLAAAAFDRVRADAPGSPTWGAADACLIAARAADAQGDGFEARNGYEKCLVLAPDFQAARRGLVAVGSGGRK